MVTRLPEAGLEPARRLGLAIAVKRGAVRCGRPSGGVMEDERSFSDICGGRLALQRRYYSPSCREFCLSCPRLSLRSLTAVTCTVWLAAYGLFTLCENSMILSAAIFITLLGLLGYLHFVKIDQETLLIIDSLGIQMTSSYASGKESTTFIEMGKVKDIVINEAIYMQKVIYYLCILLKDPVEPHRISQVVPVFQPQVTLEVMGDREDRQQVFGVPYGQAETQAR
ncbi:phosphatidylinositol N-acetylglucosaminyltransferase subunit H isoform X2 [Chlorocebus sabaeus]|uniref:phosphatidylinositol N-acetylglucosaminyltransferase subunit H isoform X2 n=1 Tax=Chlorocebus sabaeus TaxID=60711 RepID=UPI00045DF319|nr:phosphatidylinositol N-acetylglucosaminyltransferase subunit H isoform X2 [Chlorocebus sabaeus]